MNYINQHINRSALTAQFITSCPSAECACPETTGALRVAYGSVLMATMLNDLDL